MKEFHDPMIQNRNTSDIRKNPPLKSLTIDGWRAGIRFSSCHIIPHHRKCSRLHGHTYIIHLKIEGYADESGFLMDFSIIKNALRTLAETLDHRVLLPGKNDHINVSQTHGNVHVNYLEKKYMFPSEDVLILDIETLTAEILSEYIATEFIRIAQIPENIISISAGIDEGPGQGAWSTVIL